MLPGALGLRAAKVEHKLKIVLQSLLLEVGSLMSNDMVGVLDHVVSFCTDMGTELGLADYVSPGWTALMPSWLVQAADQIEADVEMPGAGEVRYEAPPRIAANVFPNSLTVPGALHVADNAALDTDKKLQHWKTWVDGLKTLTSLLSVSEHLELYRVTCLQNDTRFEALDNLFTSTCPSTVHWRWGTVVLALDYILPRRSALQRSWSPALLLKKPELSTDFDAGQTEETRRLVCDIYSYPSGALGRGAGDRRCQAEGAGHPGVPGALSTEKLGWPSWGHHVRVCVCGCLWSVCVRVCVCGGIEGPLRGGRIGISLRSPARAILTHTVDQPPH